VEAARARTWRDARWALQVLAGVALYVLLGNARSVQPNPFIPGAIIAVNMVVPVVAGIVLGRAAGFLVGVFGTLGNALSPAGSLFEWLAIGPHGTMGLVAGHLRDRAATPILAASLLVGHLLNLTLFVSFGAVQPAVLRRPALWYGLGYEALVGIMTVTVLVGVYRLAMEPPEATWP
jgi:hypothetical protein